MAWPKKTKQQQVIDEVEREAGLGAEAAVAVEEPKQEVKVEKKPKANEFNNEYTLEVSADYDPNADLFRIPNKDPEYEYRFLRSDDRNLSMKTNSLLYQHGGWQVVPKAHLIRRKMIKEGFISPDGCYRVGDNVLAFMPKHLHEKKIAAKNKTANTRLETVDRRLAHGDPTVGGVEMHESMKGIQTEKQLKGKF